MQSQLAVPTKTVGTSPKAVLAALLPAVGTVMAVVVQWLVTGEFDRAELVTSLSGLIAAAVGGLGAWLGSPGTVEVPVHDTAAAVGPASDELLTPEAVTNLTAVTEPEPAPPPPRDTGQDGYAMPGLLLILLGIGVAILVHLGLGVLMIVVGIILLVLGSPRSPRV